ncbi:MAG: chemotaxis protein CheA [Candidatus Magnetomorum sp.]|nr:chemotaxis protein CheA [Candidatus Magnetomorum sp.]
MDEMIIEFSSDLKELLSEIENALMRVDEMVGAGDTPGPDDLNEIFRNLHTIKGTCSFFEMNITRSLSHKMEDLLDLFRQGKGDINAAHVQLLFDGVDCLNKIAESIRANEPETNFEIEATGLKEKILTIINTIENPQHTDSIKIPTPQDILPLPELPEDISNTPIIQPSKKKRLQQNEMLKKFATEARDKLDVSEQVLIEMEHGTDSDPQEMIDTVRRNLHTLKGNSGFMGFKGIEKLTHVLETALEQMIDQLATITDFQLYYDAVDELRRACYIVSEGQPYTANQALIARLKGIQDNENALETEPLEKGTASSQPSGSKISETNSQTSSSKNKISPDAFVRVPVNKLDLLMDLLGEVILVASMVTHHPDIQGLELEGFENTSHQLDLLLRQLQDAAMSLRLIPISNVFQRMKRLIRDFIQETHKNIDFIITGEDTEVDKSVAEMLNDPLVHLLRNAADHGLESTEDRLASDKPETGIIRLSARQAGGELRVVVEDDGRGLNREKILAKACERGLCDPDDDPDDRTVWSYIFHPGFSTAEQITNISGRGVGMDVVMNNVKNMRGKVTIDSTPGKGSSITLHIPLTLAILDGMVIKINDILYVLPIETVVEILQPHANQINHSSVDGQFVIRIRDDLVPVLFLNQLYGQETDLEKHLENQVMMVIETDGIQLAMPVDELLGQQQVVIKPLIGHLKNIRAVSGCALLGSGSVAMVLDVSQLHQLHEKNIRV